MLLWISVANFSFRCCSGLRWKWRAGRSPEQNLQRGGGQVGTSVSLGFADMGRFSASLALIFERADALLCRKR